MCGASTRTCCGSGSTAVSRASGSTPRRSSSRTLSSPRSLHEHETGQHPYIDRDELHDIYRDWRAVADSYDPPRLLVGEIWLPDAGRFARYLRPDELHTAFNFDFLACPWEPAALRRSIEQTITAHAPVDAPAPWVLSNHDVTRPVTRYGRADTSFSFESKREGTPTDLALGYRRARAAALLTMALPGSMYIYQGEELGLPEVEDIPPEALQDPMYFRSDGVNPGRDGCRVPLPWSGDEPPYGFSPPAARRRPWLAQPAGWGALTIAAECGSGVDAHASTAPDCASAGRRPNSATGPLVWLAERRLRCSPSPVRDSFRCVVNFGAEPVPRGSCPMPSCSLRAPPSKEVSWPARRRRAWLRVH